MIKIDTVAQATIILASSLVLSCAARRGLSEPAQNTKGAVKATKANSAPPEDSEAEKPSDTENIDILLCGWLKTTNSGELYLKLSNNGTLTHQVPGAPEANALPPQAIVFTKSGLVAAKNAVEKYVCVARRVSNPVSGDRFIQLEDEKSVEKKVCGKNIGAAGFGSTGGVKIVGVTYPGTIVEIAYELTEKGGELTGKNICAIYQDYSKPIAEFTKKFDKLIDPVTKRKKIELNFEAMARNIDIWEENSNAISSAVNCTVDSSDGPMNVRETPDGKVLGKVTHKTPFLKMGESGDWLLVQIRINGNLQGAGGQGSRTAYIYKANTSCP